MRMEVDIRSTARSASSTRASDGRVSRGAAPRRRTSVVRALPKRRTLCPLDVASPHHIQSYRECHIVYVVCVLPRVFLPRNDVLLRAENAENERSLKIHGVLAGVSFFLSFCHCREFCCPSPKSSSSIAAKLGAVGARFSVASAKEK